MNTCTAKKATPYAGHPGQWDPALAPGLRRVSERRGYEVFSPRPTIELMQGGWCDHEEVWADARGEVVALVVQPYAERVEECGEQLYALERDHGVRLRTSSVHRSRWAPGRTVLLVLWKRGAIPKDPAHL